MIVTGNFKNNHGDQTKCEEKILHGRLRVLTRDLFAVAKLTVLFC